MKRYYIRYNQNSDRIETLVQHKTRRPRDLNWQEVWLDSCCENFATLEPLNQDKVDVVFRNMTNYGEGFIFEIRIIGEDVDGYEKIVLTNTVTEVKRRLPNGRYTITLTVKQGSDVLCDVALPAANMPIQAVEEGAAYVTFNNPLASVYNLIKYCIEE